MTQSPRLGLPLLAAAQAQKHVTHNEALLDIDALMHLRLVSRNVSLPPASPAEGDLHLVGASPTGAWLGKSGQVAEWRDGLWLFHAPKAGWVAWVEAEEVLLTFNGTGWQGVVDGATLENLDAVGIGISADPATPLRAKLNSALMTARSAAESGTGDLRISLNKETAPNVASCIFQSGYSGRAEIGIVGDNDFVIRTSDNGSTWREGLRVDVATAALRVPAGTVGAPSLTSAGDPNTGLFYPAADTVAVASGGAEAVRIVPGMILVNATASLGPSQAPSARFQIAGTAASNASMALGRFSANSGSSSINFLKSRSTSVAPGAAVANNDLIGTINFDGDTGSAFELGARITVAADGAPSAGSMPARLALATSPAGSVSPIERLRVAANGAVSFPSAATTASGANAFLDSASSNTLLRSTSSRRYKQDIEPIDAKLADRVLELRPVWYRSRSSHDRTAWSWYGLIAEEVADIEPRLVHWTTERSAKDASDQEAADASSDSADAPLIPDAVQYDRLPVLLIDVVRRQKLAIEQMAERVAALEAAIATHS